MEKVFFSDNFFLFSAWNNFIFSKKFLKFAKVILHSLALFPHYNISDHQSISAISIFLSLAPWLYSRKDVGEEKIFTSFEMKCERIPCTLVMENGENMESLKRNFFFFSVPGENSIPHYTTNQISPSQNQSRDLIFSARFSSIPLQGAVLCKFSIYFPLKALQLLQHDRCSSRLKSGCW